MTRCASSCVRHEPAGGRGRERDPVPAHAPGAVRCTPKEVEVKLLAATVASLSLIASAWAQGNQTTAEPGSKPMLPLDDVRMVAPAHEKYTQGPLLGDVWKRPGLAPRDRSI